MIAFFSFFLGSFASPRRVDNRSGPTARRWTDDTDLTTPNDDDWWMISAAAQHYPVVGRPAGFCPMLHQICNPRVSERGGVAVQDREARQIGMSSLRRKKREGQR